MSKRTQMIAPGKSFSQINRRRDVLPMLQQDASHFGMVGHIYGIRYLKITLQGPSSIQRSCTAVRSASDRPAWYD